MIDDKKIEEEATNYAQDGIITMMTIYRGS